MRKLIFISILLMSASDFAYGQHSNNPSFNTANFAKIPNFNYEFSISLNRYKNQYKSIYFQPLFTSNHYNRHKISYLSTNNPLYKTSELYFDKANLNPLGVSDSREALFLGGTNFMLNKLGILR